METTNIKIDDIQLADYNPREISDHDFASLKQSLKEFGMLQPIVVNKDHVIIGGHMRVRAWKDLGNTEVPCVVVDLPKDREKLLNIALNRISGQWDMEKLSEMVYKLSVESSEDLRLSGLDEVEVSGLLDSVMEIKDGAEANDDTADLTPPEIPVTKLGDIYQLGNHRLMCGNSASMEQVAILMDGKQADMIWTDPPYNVDYKSHTQGKIENDNMPETDFAEMILSVFENMRDSLKPDGAFYICTGWQSYPVFYNALRNNSLDVKGCIIWVKPSGTMGWQDYRYKHEQVIKGKRRGVGKAGAMHYGYNGIGKNKTFNGDRDEYDVWEFPRKDTTEYIHPTEKPDWLVMKAIRNSSLHDQIVLDLFSGSGSGFIACEKTGRKMYGMELDPKFCDVIIRRWEAMTKQTAIKLNNEPGE